MGTQKYPAESIIVAGGATEAKQDAEIALLTTIDADTSALVLKDFATSAKQDAQTALLTTIDADTSALVLKDFSTSAKQDTTNTKLDTIHTDLQSITSNTNIGVIDQIDSTPLLDCSSTAIPASSGNPLTVVASLAAACKKIVSVEDIGEYIGLYTGVALSEVLYCILPLGGGEIQVNIPIATRISLRAMNNTAITSSKIALNFLG